MIMTREEETTQLVMLVDKSFMIALDMRADAEGTSRSAAARRIMTGKAPPLKV